MDLSLIPTEILIRMFLDMALAIAVAVAATGRPSVPDHTLQQLGQPRVIIGMIALLRGLWLLPGVPNRISLLLSRSDEMTGQVTAMLIAGLVVVLCTFGLGLALVHRAIANRMGDDQAGARDVILKVGGFFYRLRGVMIVLITIGVFMEILPYLPSSGGTTRRRRRLF